MIWQSILLGITQGFTEFLPISSSGHLVLLEAYLGVSTPGALFESVLHLGTMAAVVIYFFKKLLHIDQEMLKSLIIGTVPVAIIGFFLKDPIEALFSSTKIVGFALLVTALINYYIDKYSGRKEKVDSIDAIIIGLTQAIAIIPGISRSGSTILAAKSLKIDGEKAAEFSFLLSLPAIMGANILQFYSHGFSDNSHSVWFYVAGFITAFTAGYLAIDLMMKLIVSKRLKVFTFYCLALGLFAIFVS